MAFDLLVKNGMIVDGSGLPRYRGDVGVKDGKIAEIGRITGDAPKRRSTPRATSWRRASSTATPTWTRRSSGIRSAPAPATRA